MRGSNSRGGWRPVVVTETVDDAPLDFSLDKPKRVDVALVNKERVAAPPAVVEPLKQGKVRKFREKKYADDEYWIATYLANQDFQVGIRDGLSGRPFVENHASRHAAVMYEQGRLWAVSLNTAGDTLPKMPRPGSKPNGKVYGPAVQKLTKWDHYRAWSV